MEWNRNVAMGWNVIAVQRHGLDIINKVCKIRWNGMGMRNVKWNRIETCEENDDSNILRKYC